jgi:hypothetical protein
MVAFTAILAVISALQYCNYRSQLTTTRIVQRAWVGAPRIEPREIESGKITFDFFFKNVGQTPLTGLYVDAALVAKEKEADVWGSTGMEGKCVKGRDESVTDFRQFSITPGDVFHFPFSSAPSMNGKPYTEIAAVKNMVKPHIVGCIIYGTQFDSTRHQTKFMAPLEWRDDSVVVPYVFTVEPN